MRPSRCGIHFSYQRRPAGASAALRDLRLGGEPLRLRQLLVLQVEPRNKAAALVLVNDAPLDDLEIT